jgi:multidrug efflux pump subunit AcrA (membrane-fusion protein)
MSLLTLPYRIYRTLVVWYGKKAVLGALLLCTALLALGFSMKEGKSPESQSVNSTMRKVTLASLSELSNGTDSLSVVGTVSALREARLTAESGGRVTSVRVKLGDQVRAGTVLGSIENKSEQALLLQARGAYQAAQAGKSSGNVSLKTAEQGVTEARTGALNAARAALTSADGALTNTGYEFFSNPDTLYPGLLIDGRGDAPSLNTELVRLRELIAQWRTKTEGDPLRAINDAEQNAKRVSIFIARLSALYAEDANIPANLAGRGASLSGARAALDGTLAQLSGARNGLTGAESALAQAKIAAEAGTPSLGDAQLTQALGTLRLAEANLEKTIIRSPISGTVQSLNIKEGTTIGMGMPTAVISSEGALEISSSISAEDATRLAVGDTVGIEGNAEGTVTEIASALDPVTKKIAVRFGVTDPKKLVNGSTVNVFLATEKSERTQTAVLLPISALKMTPNGAVIFTVSEKSALVPHQVKLGAIVGDRVTILSGIDGLDQIVVDARGLRQDEIVEVSK